MIEILRYATLTLAWGKIGKNFKLILQIFLNKKLPRYFRFEVSIECPNLVIPIYQWNIHTYIFKIMINKIIQMVCRFALYNLHFHFPTFIEPHNYKLAFERWILLFRQRSFTITVIASSSTPKRECRRRLFSRKLSPECKTIGKGVLVLV